MDAITIQGKKANHLVMVTKWMEFETYDGALDFYTKNLEGKSTMWEPENGADFKSLGQATGWLKKLLKKDGWPQPTKWMLVQYFIKETGRKVFSIFNLE